MKVTTIGIDLAKDVFGLHGVDGKGRFETASAPDRTHGHQSQGGGPLDARRRSPAICASSCGPRRAIMKIPFERDLESLQN
jgi:hypothetical protein